MPINFTDVNGAPQVDSLPLYGEDFVPLKTVTEEDILITAFTGLVLSASVPADGKLHRIYWGENTPGSFNPPNSGCGYAFLRDDNAWVLLAIYGSSVVTFGAIAMNGAGFVMWRHAADRTWSAEQFQLNTKLGNIKRAYRPF